MKELVPYIAFSGNCEEALNFYKDVFGGKIMMIMRYSDGPAEYQNESNRNNIMHSEIDCGGFTFMAADEMRPKEEWSGSRVSLSINFHSPEEQKSVYDKLSSGGKITMPLQDTFWGATFGILIDRYGICWMCNYDRPQS